MKQQIMFAAVDCEIRNGRIVVAEFLTGSDTKARGIVHEVKAKRKVRTLHGNVSPSYLYSFDNAREAQEFINAV